MSSRPMTFRTSILAGAGAVRSHAAAAVTELADRLHIPVVNTMMAKGIIPMDDKYSLWTIGIPQKDYVNQLFDRADVVIAIGYDIVECAPAAHRTRQQAVSARCGSGRRHFRKSV